jgi:hypothetical protein
MTDAPDNVDRALDLLRRQHYHEVADYFEKLQEDSND